MLVEEVMCAKPEYMSPDATLKDAADEMQRLNLGFLPVGENDRLIGAITDRDITIRAVASGKSPINTTIREVMTSNICWCFTTDDIEKAVNDMIKNHVRRLVVLNTDKRLAGILSLSDIALKAKNDKLVTSVLMSLQKAA